MVTHPFTGRQPVCSLLQLSTSPPHPQTREHTINPDVRQLKRREIPLGEPFGYNHDFRSTYIVTERASGRARVPRTSPVKEIPLDPCRTSVRQKRLCASSIQYRLRYIASSFTDSP